MPTLSVGGVYTLPGEPGLSETDGVTTSSGSGISLSMLASAVVRLRAIGSVSFRVAFWARYVGALFLSISVVVRVA